MAVEINGIDCLSVINCQETLAPDIHENVN